MNKLNDLIMNINTRRIQLHFYLYGIDKKNKLNKKLFLEKKLIDYTTIQCL